MLRGVVEVGRAGGVDALSLADDGPGDGATVLVFPADRLGNPADPALPSTTVVLHGGTGLKITSPDSDGNPLQETITFTTAEAVAVTLDDTGASADSGAITDLVATVDGVPTAAVRITIGTGSGGGGNTGTITAAQVKLSVAGSGRDRVRLTGSTAATMLDPSTVDVHVTLSSGAQTIYDRLLPIGAFPGGGRRYAYKDAPGARGRRKIVIVRHSDGTYGLRAAVTKLTLPVSAAIDPVTLSLTVGSDTFASTLTCDANHAGTATRCR